MACAVGMPGGWAASPPNVLGLTLPLTGPQAEVAKELLAGYQIALAGAGGQLSLKVIDDMAKPDQVVANVKQLALNPSVIAVSGIVGTPHAQAALPVAIQMGLPVVGIRSGLQALRDGKAGVYHLRSSYDDELQKLAVLCKGGGLSRVAILYSDDSFGAGARDHLVQRLKENGVDAVTVAADRNGENLEKAAEKIAQEVTKAATPTGVALLMISKPMMASAKLLREKHKIVMPIFAMSFVATKALSSSEDPSFNGLGLISAFPLPMTSPQTLAMQYRAHALAAKRGDMLDSLTAFEGYFYGSVVANAAVNSGSREALVKRLENGLMLAGNKVKFDIQRVGFKYLEVIRKSAGEKFRA